MFFSNAPQHRDTMMLLLPYRVDFTFWLSPKSKQKAPAAFASLGKATQ